MDCPIQQRFYTKHLNRGVKVYLQTGVRLAGTLAAVSATSLVISTQNCRMLVMKQRITSVAPGNGSN